jgi:hypothetical protein
MYFLLNSDLPTILASEETAIIIIHLDIGTFKDSFWFSFSDGYPRLQPAIAEVSKAVGTSFQINCSSTLSITWVADNGQTLGTISASVVLSDNLSTLTFNIITTQNAGEFLCRDAANVEARFRLNVFTGKPCYIFLLSYLYALDRTCTLVYSCS